MRDLHEGALLPSQVVCRDLKLEAREMSSERILRHGMGEVKEFCLMMGPLLILPSRYTETAIERKGQMDKPERRIMVYGDGEKIIVPFDCVYDDGLLSCEDPRGKRFTLVDARGLHATIEVDARAGYEYRPAWKKGSQYSGLISVEGYTVEGLHSVGTVDIVDGRIASVTYGNKRWMWRDNPHAQAVCREEELAVPGATIATRQGERNEEAFRSFPRWQAFFAGERAHASNVLSPSSE